MKARILATATLATCFAGILPAVDQNLLNLVMPDAKILAGVNVVSAKNSPFGQYVLGQLAPKEQEFQKMAVLTGFDPRNDLIELLAASNGVPASNTGLVLASGTFNTTAITGAAALHGATVDQYHGATLVTEPNQTGTPSGIAFLGSTMAIAGDLANVKAAVDRQSSPSKIDSGLASQAATLSANQDAWVVTIVPPPMPTGPAANAQQTPVPGVPAGALQQIRAGSAGVKFGTNVVVTAQATTDTAQNATNLAGMLQLLTNMMKLQADKNPQAAALANAFVVSASGTTINLTFSLPEDQLQKLVSQPKPAAVRGHLEHKKQ